MAVPLNTMTETQRTSSTGLSAQLTGRFYSNRVLIVSCINLSLLFTDDMRGYSCPAAIICGTRGSEEVL